MENNNNVADLQVPCYKLSADTARTVIPALLARLGMCIVGISYRGDSVGYVRSELSCLGVYIIRTHAAKVGWTGSDCEQLLRDELARIRNMGLAATEEGLNSYLSASRVGSGYQMNRRLRRAVFAQIVGRGCI